MTLSQSHPYLAPEEYLEAEKSSLIKHEYILISQNRLFMRTFLCQKILIVPPLSRKGFNFDLIAPAREP